jgi:alpha-L-fucosidase
MIKILILSCILSSTSAFAQWSILEDDPRAKNPGHLYQVFPQEEWDNNSFASEKELQWFRDAKYGMFLHFGLSTYKNVDLSWGICEVRKAPDGGSGPYPKSEWETWPDEFKIPEFDAEKLVKTAQDAGMKYIVVVAKHHDGFHLWDTEHSDFKVTNTPFARDFLKEIADACHRQGMKFGIYYSQRDWYHPDYCPIDTDKVIRTGNTWTLKPGETDKAGESHKKYLEYQFNAVRELCTKYGEVDIFWFDAAYWGKMFTADMWDAENLESMIRKLQPGIIINNRTGLPGDFDTPEQRIGMFQNYRPWESCMSLCDSWCYSYSPIKSPKEIIRILVNTLCGDGNLLMSWGPLWSGAFHPDQIDALEQAGTWIKQNEKAIYATRGGPWKPAKWGGSAYRDKTVYLHILNMPANHKLVLTGLQQKVLKATLYNSANVEFQQIGDRLELSVPAELIDSMATIVELRLDAPITEIIEQEVPESIFEAPEYGSILSENAVLKISSTSQWDSAANHAKLLTGNLDEAEFAFHTDFEKNPWAVIDLGGEFNVKGILIQHRSGYDYRKTGMITSVSTDGQNWERVWSQEDLGDKLEIPVTSYVAGAHLPGRSARYIKVERILTEPDALHLHTLKVYGE